MAQKYYYFNTVNLTHFTIETDIRLIFEKNKENKVRIIVLLRFLII